MIEFKNPNVRVTCFECYKESSIEMKLIDTDKIQRTISMEYQFTYYGEKTCTCGNCMKIETMIFEYPKGTFNYQDTNSENCLDIDELTVESFNIIDKDIDIVKEEKEIIKCPVCKSTDISDDSIYENNGIIGHGYSTWKVSNNRSCNNCGVIFKLVKGNGII